MLNLLTQRKLTLTPNQYTGLLLFQLLCCEMLIQKKNQNGRKFKNVLSITESLNLLNRIDIRHLILLMTQTSGRIYEYVMRNSNKKLTLKPQCILFVNKKHPFLNRQIIIEEKKITSPVFLQVLGDYLNEINMNPTARNELKELITQAMS